MVSAPTIDDARTAGRALTCAGAREVLAFGSVARGDADPHSDIDLVVILDDLEYRRRRDAAEALEKLAVGATGQRVDVWLTDAPEWAAQNRRAASFAAAIKGDLVVVAARNGDDSAIRWDKEQVMATSDTEDAWRRLDEVRTHLQRLIRRHHPDHIERSASAGYAADKMARRHGRRSVNNTIDRLTAEFRQLAASIDISTGERLSPDPGDDPARGL